MEKRSINNKFRLLAVFAGIILIVLGFVLANGGYENYLKDNNVFNCSFSQITGFPCPGCGGTRAYVYLFKGKLISSFKSNAAVIVFFIEYLIFLIDRKRRIKLHIYAYIFAAVLILQWIVKIIVILV